MKCIASIQGMFHAHGKYRGNYSGKITIIQRSLSCVQEDHERNTNDYIYVYIYKQHTIVINNAQTEETATKIQSWSGSTET